MGQRTVGIDLAIRGDHVARILDDGRPQGRPIRFRLTPDSLDRLLAGVRDGLPPGGTVTAVMEPTGMAWFPVARWLEQAGMAAKSKLSRLFTAGNRASRMRRSIIRRSRSSSSSSARRSR